MHQSVMDFIRSALRSEEVSGKFVLEVGSYNVNGSPRTVIEPLGPRLYVGLDFQLGPGVDVVADITAPDLVDFGGHVGYDLVVSTEMLEHVTDWRAAVCNMKRAVRTGGTLLVTTRSPGFPYHPFPDDHWRFTLEHFREIFADMEVAALVPDQPSSPGVFLKARRTDRPLLTAEELGRIEPGRAR